MVAPAAGQSGAMRRGRSLDPRGLGHAVAGGDPDLVAQGNIGQWVRVQARLRIHQHENQHAVIVNGVARDGAAAVKPVQPRNRDRVRPCPRSGLAADVNDGGIGRNRRDGGRRVAVFQIQVHASGVLEPAQSLRVVRQDALGLLLVVRSSGIHRRIARHVPLQVHAGIQVDIFQVVVRAAHAVKQTVFRIHHDCGGAIGGRVRHQLIRIFVVPI